MWHGVLVLETTSLRYGLGLSTIPEMLSGNLERFNLTRCDKLG